MTLGELTVSTGSRHTDSASTRRPSQFRRNLKRFLIENRLNLAGAIIVVLFFVLAIFGQWLAPQDPYPWISLMQSSCRLRPIIQWAQMSWGETYSAGSSPGRASHCRLPSFVLTFAVVFGTLVGLVAGYAGGLVDEALMRLTDMFLAFPALVLAIAVSASLGRNLQNTMIALATVFWPWYARFVRAQVLSIKEREFIEAARSVGLNRTRIVMRHIFPNVVAVIIIQLTIDVGFAVLATSSLSFLGLGAQPPSPEWGTMLAVGPKLLPRRLVVHDISRNRADTDSFCLQRAWRWTAGCPQSALRFPIAKRSAESPAGSSREGIQKEKVEPSPTLLVAHKFAAMSLDNVLGYRQSQSGSFRPARTVCFVESLEDASQFFLRNSITCVRNIDANPILGGRGRDRDRTTRRCELDCVVQQIDDDLLDTLLIDIDHRKRWFEARVHRQSSPFDERSQTLDTCLQDIL